MAAHHFHLLFIVLSFVNTFAHKCEEQDQKIWDATNGGKKNFEGDMKTCDERCMFDAHCTEDLIRENLGYSKDCATAFGDLATCSGIHCWMFCRPLEGTLCNDCKREHCYCHFYEESGFDHDATASFLSDCAESSEVVRTSLRRVV